MPKSPGTLELPGALAKAGPQKGEPSRNPTGWNGTARQRLTNRDIKRLLALEGSEPCTEPGFTHMSKMQYMVHQVWEEAQRAERWAVTFICNRLFGRIPLTVEMDVDVTLDYARMSREELLARLDTVRGQLTSGEVVPPSGPDVLTEAVLVEAGEPQGSSPVGNEPKGL